MAPLLVAALDELVQADALPRERRPGAEFLAWSAVQGPAMLLIDEPLRSRDQAQTHHIGHRLLNMAQNGLEAAGPFRRGIPFRQLWYRNDGGAISYLAAGRVDRPLEVAAPIEMGSHLRSSQLVQGDAVAAGRPKRTARPRGDLHSLLPLPTMGRQLNQGGVKVGHPVHQDRPVPLDMVGQQHQRRTLGELDRGDPGPHRLDSKDHPAAQDLGEVRKVRGHISAGRVQEVELLEGCGLVSHGP